MINEIASLCLPQKNSDSTNDTAKDLSTTNLTHIQLPTSMVGKNEEFVLIDDKLFASTDVLMVNQAFVKGGSPKPERLAVVDKADAEDIARIINGILKLRYRVTYTFFFDTSIGNVLMFFCTEDANS